MLACVRVCLYALYNACTHYMYLSHSVSPSQCVFISLSRPFCLSTSDFVSLLLTVSVTASLTLKLCTSVYYSLGECLSVRVSLHLSFCESIYFYIVSHKASGSHFW